MQDEDGYENFPENASLDQGEDKGFIEENRVSLIFALLGLLSVGMGLFFYKDGLMEGSSDVEIIGASETEVAASTVIVEVSGAVSQPGVYEMENGSRINDLILMAGGLQDNADGEYLDKIVNRAAKLSDGQKIYIPSVNEQSDMGSANSSTGGSGSLSGNGQNILGSGDTQTKRVNVNTASKSELENLWGIGPVTAQNIIDQRPYSSVEELLVKKILKNNVFERNKDLLSVY